MDFDSYTIAFHVRNPDAPVIEEAAAATLQDAHLDHLARLHEEGIVLAAGPLLGDDNEAFRGLTVLAADPDRAARLLADDPAVRAGRFTLKLLPWTIPAGAVTYARTRFPHSMTDVRE